MGTDEKNDGGDEPMKIAEQWRGIWVIAYRDLLRFTGDRIRLVSALAMPIIFLVIFGAGFNNVIGQLAPGIDFMKFVYPGIIAMTVLNSSLMSGLSIVWDREFGFLREVLVAPLSRGSVVAGKIVGSAVISLAQGIIMLVIAPIVDVRLTAMLVLKLVPVLLIISISISALGILIASRMRSQQGFQLVMMVLLMPMTFLSGVMFPVNNVPVWMEVISKVNPLTYGVDAVRQLFLAVQPLPAGIPAGIPMPSAIGVTVFGRTMGVLDDTLVVAGLGILLLIMAVVTFSRQE
ncbi:MAG: ABC transporter permease [Dehalococcoidia bacterium]|nr:ABC transporter permease [Dehalococcoidia bacterium]